MPDQSNMNETNLQYRHKNQLPLIFPKVYYGRSYQTPFEDLSLSYQRRDHYQSHSKFCHFVIKIFSNIFEIKGSNEIGL